MLQEEKETFRKALIGARTLAEVGTANRQWMEWYVNKFGSSMVSKQIQGSEYFSFFAEKLKNNEHQYTDKDWYWTYMFYMVNETARLYAEAHKPSEGIYASM